MLDAKTILLFLGLCFVARVTSVPTANAVEARDSNDVYSDTWTTPAFLACLLKKFPNFPNGVTEPSEINNCRNSLGKRDVGTLNPNDIVGELATRNNDDLLDPQDIVGELAERGVDNRFQTRAGLKDLIQSFQVNAPYCPENKLPKNFEEAAPMRAKAQGLCGEIGGLIFTQVNATLHDKLQDNGTFGAVSEILSDAYTKTDSWLHGKKKVLLYLVLSLSPQGRAALGGINMVQENSAAVCTAALTMLSTKDEGCTKDIHFLKHHSFLKGGQTTGITGGIIDLFIENSHVGFLSTAFTKPT